MSNAAVPPSQTSETSRSGQTGHPVVRWAVRGAWLAFALFLLAFAIFESAKYGGLTIAATIVFLILPDLTFLIGMKDAPTLRKGQLSPKAVPFYNWMHRVWAPLVILVGYSVSPLEWPPLFAAGLAWLAHIAFDRAAGYGLRTPTGFRRND